MLIIQIKGKESIIDARKRGVVVPNATQVSLCFIIVQVKIDSN